MALREPQQNQPGIVLPLTGQRSGPSPPFLFERAALMNCEPYLCTKLAYSLFS